MVYTEPMARAVLEPAVLELVQQCGDGQEHSTTVSFGGDGFTMYAHVRVRPAVAGQVDVSLACWVVHTDTARYFGSTLPSEEETRLPPQGTATPDGSLTSRVIGHVATRMNALDPARPESDGHLVVTVPLTPRREHGRKGGGTRRRGPETRRPPALPGGGVCRAGPGAIRRCRWCARGGR